MLRGDGWGRSGSGMDALRERIGAGVNAMYDSGMDALRERMGSKWTISRLGHGCSAGTDKWEWTL